MRVLPLAEAKAKLSKLVADVEISDEEITITKNGRAAAVLVSYAEFERWQETAAILADRRFSADVRKGIASLRKGRAKTFRSRELDRLFAAGR